MANNLLAKLKELSMLSYIQLEQDFIVYVEGAQVVIPRSTILPVHHKNLGKRYYVDRTEILHVAYMDLKFQVYHSTKYRWLTPTESMLYQQPVTVVEKRLLIPVSEQINEENVALLVETKPIKVGTILYIDGFAYDTYYKKYVPFTKHKNIKFELGWEVFIPTLAFESLFRQSKNSCLPLGKHKLLL